MEALRSRPELLRQLRSIEIRTRRLADEQLAGTYSSVFKGQGLSFHEVREYIPGDDVRFIDWNVSARMNEPYVKVFVEEREMTVMLVVDLSASEQWGTRRASKARVAAEVGALCAFSAIKNNDHVGLVLATEVIEKLRAAQEGRQARDARHPRDHGLRAQVPRAPTSRSRSKPW